MQKSGVETTKTKNEDIREKIADRSEVDNFAKREEVPIEEWRERLLKIHNQQIKLKYTYEIVPPKITYTLPKTNVGVDEIGLPNLDIQTDSISKFYEEQETISTEKYEFDREEIELENGISVQPLAVGGMVSKKGEPNGGNAVVFFSPGGKLTLKPSNMGDKENKEAELAMMHIISIQQPGQQGDESDIEISAYLREPMVFSPKDKYQVELKQGEYIKHGNSDQGKLKFADTQIRYNQEVLVDKIEVELNESAELIPSNKKGLKQVIEEYSSSVLDDDALKAEFSFENEGEWLKTYYMIVVGDTPFYLTSPERKNGELTAKSATAKFYGFSIELEDVTAEDHEYITAKNGKTNADGKDVKLSDVKVEALDSDVLKAETAETVIEGFTTILNRYKLEKEKGTSYKDATVKTQLNFGKNTEKPEKTKTTAQDFVDFQLGENSYTKEGFHENTKSKNLGASKNLKVKDAVDGVTREASVFEGEIYTLDGFAKLEDPEFVFTKKEKQRAELEGHGKVKFLKVPYSLTMKDGTVISGLANGKDAVEDVKFHVDSAGNLDAEFEDDAEAILNLNHMKGKENETENIIRTFTLGSLSIEKGYLQVNELRMDRGVSIGQEGYEKTDGSGSNFSEKAQSKLGMDDKILKIFNCTLSGTVATKSDEVQMNADGIKAKMKKSTFGTYKTEDFMGFLGGEIDYPNGKIGVSAKKEVETENPEASFFQLMNQNLAETLYIPTGIPGVQAKFGLKPSASIGGEVGLSVERGKAFDEKWENQDELKFNGEIKTDGKASIAAEAGVELGIPVLANVDFKVGGELGAKIEGGLEGETKFKYTEKEEKLHQSDDFEFKGKLGGELKGALNLSSNVKFLFWNTQLFQFELLKKELGKLEFSGAGSKDHTQKSLTKGWNIKSGEFSAQWFSKEIGRKYRNEKAETVEKKSSEELKKLVADSGKDTEDAWAVLCELKEKRKNTLILLSKSDKDALDTQIETITKEVMKKVEQYMILLEESETALAAEEEAMQKEVEEKGKQLNVYQKQEGMSNDVFQKAEWGGFQQSNYALEETPQEIKREDYKYLDDKSPENKQFQKKAQKKYNADVKSREAIMKQQKERNSYKSKMAAIDLMIARILGEVSEENLKRIRDAYDEKTRNENALFSKYLFETMDKEEQRWQYEFDTTFVHTGLSLYEDQSSYYGVLNKKAIFKQRKYRNAYDKEGVVFKRTESDFPKPFRAVVEKNPNIKMKDLLRCALQNKAPDGMDLNATPEQKLQLLRDAFGFAEKITLDDKIFKREDKMNAADLIRGALAKKTGEKFANVFSTSLDDVISGKNIISIFEERQKLSENLERAKMRLEESQKMLNTVQATIQQVKSKKSEYEEKLKSLKNDSQKALKDKLFDSSAAKNVIDIYSNDYIGSMKKGQEIRQNKDVQNVMKWAMDNRKLLRGKTLL